MSSSPAVLSIRPPYAMPAPLPEFSTSSGDGGSEAALALVTPFAGPGVHPVAWERTMNAEAEAPHANAADSGADNAADIETRLSDGAAPGASDEAVANSAETGTAAPVAAEAATAETQTPELDVADAEATEAETMVEASAEEEPDSEVDADPDGELPSIEQFLMQGEAPNSGDWPIADAADDIAELVSDMRRSEPVSDPFVTGPQAGTPASAGAPWSDDEAWMDIMPALPNTGAGDDAARSDWARAFAEPLAPLAPPPLPAGDALAAATALEGIARRLRSGELDVPGFEADRGDAAALAAALASLLGARR